MSSVLHRFSEHSLATQSVVDYPLFTSVIAWLAGDCGLTAAAWLCETVSQHRVSPRISPAWAKVDASITSAPCKVEKLEVEPS